MKVPELCDKDKHPLWPPTFFSERSSTYPSTSDKIQTIWQAPVFCLYSLFLVCSWILAYLSHALVQQTGFYVTFAVHPKLRINQSIES